MNTISRWFIDNPVASKILMLVILLGGYLSFPIISKQFFPVAEINIVRVSMIYPGAGPEEVESQIVKRIEEAVQELSGIEEIRSNAREGSAEVSIEVASGQSTLRLLNDVKASVESITTFPADAESPKIVEIRFQNTFMRLILSGDLSEHELKELGESIREEVAGLPSVTNAQINGVRDYEVSIEISESSLLHYGLSFQDVADAIRAYSFNLPTGKISDVGGDIQLQARLQAEDAEDFREIPILRTPEGGIVRVGDVAVIKDTFVDLDLVSRYDGQRALQIEVINRENPQILVSASAVRAYVERKRAALPDGVNFEVWSDSSVNYQGRLDTLIKNGAGGLVLVFIVLVFFLRPILALWVCLGIVVAFSGAMWTLSMTPISLNILSMFAFIMILGIIVDDAIIVGEAVHSEQQRLKDYHLGAIKGVQSIMMPVWFAVASTIVFFVPFFFLSDSPNTSHLGGPVILALLFSLVESLMLLPSHLSTGGFLRAKKVFEDGVQKSKKGIYDKFESFRLRVADTLPYVANNQYRRLLLRSISSPGYTLLVFFLFLGLALSLVRGGWINTTFFPRVSSDYIIATATLPESAPYSLVRGVMERLEAKGVITWESINETYDDEVVQGVYAAAYNNTANVYLRLDTDGDRPVSANDIARQWREEIGEISGLKDLDVRFTIFDIPKPISLSLRSDDSNQLIAYSEEMKRFMATVDGVYDIRSSLENPVQEINFELNSNAESLSITTFDVANQIRRAFYGEEVQQIPRKREDVKVFVRFPEQDREYEERLLNMRIQAPDGQYLPLSALVDFEYRESLKTIERVDGRRIAEVSSDVQPGFSNEAIISQAMDFAEQVLAAKYPDVILKLEGEQQENREFLDKLTLYFVLSMLVIYGLMAVMFRSYLQPLLVLSAIPFGYMGGVFGHFLLGIELSMFSMLGMLACAGVVVNDNVVLIDRINTLLASGKSVRVAVVNAGIQRFRPIILTSVTTFLGLTPILLEQSVQAQFLIPMVTSLSFGVLMATTVTLLFVPCLYLFAARMGRYALGANRSATELSSRAT